MSRAPILDIVLLVHDQAGWADIAIRAVESFTRNHYRLIIVDNASIQESTKALLAEAETRGHTVIRLAANKSFSNGINTGVNHGTSPFIVILNSDAIVTEGWDTAMLQDAAPKHIGLVGSRSNYVSGAQGDPSFTGEPPYIAFVCAAMRRAVWNAIGPMDEVTFDGFSTEDIDYSWRVKKGGLDLKISSAYVLHAGSKTLQATIGADRIARNNEIYNQRLLDKHGRDWYAAHASHLKKGLVVSFHAEEHTRVEFLKHLINLRNTKNVGFSYLQVCRAPIQLARAMAADYAVDQGYDWFVQLDDDATFPDDVIKRLVAHDKDIVCALAYQRRPPHWPCIFELGEDKTNGKPLEGLEHTGLRKIDVSGFHCSIMKTSVIKRMREGTKDAEGKVLVPGTRQYFGGFDNKVGEDFAFCLNARKLGIQVWTDTDLIAGHIGDAINVDENYKRSYEAQQAAKRG